MQVCTETWPSSALGRPKSVTVALPTSYSRQGPSYPVVYLLHGFGGNRHTWLRSVDLAAELDRHQMIAVLPECGRLWFIDDARGRCYERYLLADLVPNVDANYHTVARRTGRAVAGFSMGGASAVFQTLRHPNVFSVAGSHSGAFEAPFRDGDPYAHLRQAEALMMPTVREHERAWGPMGSEVRRVYNPYRLIDQRDQSLPIGVYADVGTEDYPRMISMNRNMRDALEGVRLDLSYRERPGAHDWAFVRGGVGTMFSFIAARVSRGGSAPLT